MRAIAAPEPKTTLLEHALRAVFGVVLFAICLPAFSRSTPLTLTEGRVMNSVVHAGDVLSIDWTQTWNKLCEGTSAREIVRSDRKIDHYDAVSLEPPSTTGSRKRGGGVQLSEIMPKGPAKYRAVVTFPPQFSLRCILLWPIQFTTPEVPFFVSN